MAKRQPTDDTKPPPRRGFRPLQVMVTPDEKAAIAAHAKACGLSVSGYLRTLGIGMDVKSTVDQQAISNLVHVNADLGRLGGLLKLALTDDRNNTTAADIRALLNRIEASRVELLKIARGLRGAD